MWDTVLFLFGLAIGSFLNVVIDRIPRGESIVFGRSRCDYCKKTLRWFELIPVLSYLIQGGRCVRCHKRLSVQYPLVELFTGAVFVALPHMQAAYGPAADALYGYHLAALCSIASAGIVILVTDLKYQIIPDRMLIVLVLAAGALLYPSPLPTAVQKLGVGAVSGSFFYLLWLGTRGRGMGFGDVKLSAVLGLLLGFPQAIIAFYTAFLTGAGYGVILIIQRKAGMKSRVPFGPFLLLGAVVSVVWTAPVLHWAGFI